MSLAGRASAFSYKGKGINLVQIARELNVTYILQGSVRKTGDQAHITAQLVKARSDTRLWLETYICSLEYIFATQKEIASDVAAQMKVTLPE